MNVSTSTLLLAVATLREEIEDRHVDLATLREEIEDRHVDLSLHAEALPAARELIRRPRATWPQPRDAWESLVVAVAAALLRLQGRQMASTAREAIRLALAELAHQAEERAAS